jgi:hypothetical protein
MSGPFLLIPEILLRLGQAYALSFIQLHQPHQAVIKNYTVSMRQIMDAAK